MVDNAKLLKYQSMRGARSTSTDSVAHDPEWVVNECRQYIKERSDTFRGMDPVKKHDAIKEAIISYVMSDPPIVDGFVDEDNKPDTMKLADFLVSEITDYGILSDAIADPDVYEIRVNGREIKVEIKGHVTDLRDKDGNIVMFRSPDQQATVFRRLMGDARLNPTYAVVNTRTVEGYRVAAVHHTGLSPDPDDPTGDVYNAMVLRKFKKSKMRLPDIIKFGTLSDGMGKLLRLLPAGGLSFFTVGPTASGKTTLNNAILQEVPATTRTVLLQNPSEIDLRMKDNSGRIYNDVLHLEAIDKEGATVYTPTMENLMAHILRLSPTFVCFGELRKNIEFKMGMQIAQAGHPINCTFHAKSSAGAVKRFLTAYLAESGNEPAALALESMVDVIDIIIVQKIMRDGTRKVIQISEVIGADPTQTYKAILNDIYRFDIIGDPEVDAQGNVTAIHGRHRRVGKLSERTIRTLQLEGVPKYMYEFLTHDPVEGDEEQYTGDIMGDTGKYAGTADIMQLLDMNIDTEEHTADDAMTRRIDDEEIQWALEHGTSDIEE